MKFSTVLVAIFATAVAADGVKPPKCAKKCMKSAFKVSNCDKKDTNCMCKSEPFHQAVVPCIKDKCEKSEIEEMAVWVKKTCGYNIEIKPAGH